MKSTILYLFIAANFVQTMALEKRHCILTDKYNVYVANNLGLNSQPLVVHCASKDDDLGNHTLAIRQSFNWNFCESYFERTLFFCHFWWGSKNKQFNVFSSNHKKDCYNFACYWEARVDGIYFSGNYPPMSLDKKYDWDI
ncbi:hypothetical protein Pfo_029174 [Paulownia fortunei]|nr:hypothetical protein Pfo_029174 [Paulownia fortunei]